MAGVGATHIDHVVIGSSHSARTAKHFSETFGIEILRVFKRPGSGAHMEFAKLKEVVLEFAGPGEEPDNDDIKARLGGIVLAVDDMDGAIAHLREAGYDAGDPHPAVQPGAVFAAIKSGTHGMPLGLIQYNAIPEEDGDSN